MRRFIKNESDNTEKLSRQGYHRQSDKVMPCREKLSRTTFKDKVTEGIQSKVICYYDNKKCIPQRKSVCLK